MSEIREPPGLPENDGPDESNLPGLESPEPSSLSEATRNVAVMAHPNTTPFNPQRFMLRLNPINFVLQSKIGWKQENGLGNDDHIPWYSWMLFTVSSRDLRARMASTEASAAARLVAWEIFMAMAPERILTSSSRDSWLLGVLMMK